MSLTDLVVPPWAKWLAFAILLALAFSAGVRVEGWRRDSLDLDRVSAELDAKHKGWVQATERWAARDKLRLELEAKNATKHSQISTGHETVRTEVDHAPLFTPEQLVAACPDPRGAEWLRLYNRAARLGAGPEADAAPSVPDAPP